LICFDFPAPSHFSNINAACFFIWPFLDLDEDFIARIMRHIGIAAQSITAEIYHRRMMTKAQLYVFNHNRPVFIIPGVFSIQGYSAIEGQYMVTIDRTNQELKVNLLSQLPRTLERHHPSGRKLHILSSRLIPPFSLPFFSDAKFTESADQNILT
jgi:hypothetical protein